MSGSAVHATGLSSRRRLCPVKVAVIDVEQVPDGISAERPGAEPYEGLWLLVRADGVPRRLAQLEFDGGLLTRDALEPYLAGIEPGGEGEGRTSALADPPLISVVVCSVMRRHDELERCLASIARLDYPAFELIVVDNRPGADDVADEWLRRYPQARFLRERRPGLSVARNCGLEAATGELVAFTDDDVVVDAGWLTAYANRFVRHPEEVCVTGMVLPNNLETEAQVDLEEYYDRVGLYTLEALSYRPATGGRGGIVRVPMIDAVRADGTVVGSFALYEGARFGGGSSMAFRTSALREIDGFDVALGAGTRTHGGEDLIVFERLAWRGHSLGYEPAALAFHVHRHDAASLRRQIKGYGVGFTAAATALIIEDPRHLGGMLATVPRALRMLSSSFWAKWRTPRRAGGDDPGPQRTTSGLARLELLGMAQGPLAYVRARWHARRGRRR